MKFVAIFAVIFFWIFLATPLSAAIIFVDDDNVVGPWDGSLNHPYQFIRDGIDAAVDGDTVIVNDGTYKGDSNRDLDFNGRALTLESKNGPDVTIIDCEGSEGNEHRGFFIANHEGSDTVVNGFTIQNGYVDDRGGGIYCYYYSSPTIKNCVISGNLADEGGGIYCSDSSPTIKNCVISGNLASDGGGIYFGGKNPTIINCTILRNTAKWYGGGIYCYESSPTIANCTISENQAYFYGRSSPKIVNSIFWDDTPYTFYLSSSGTPTVTYSNIKGGTNESWFGKGCIDTDPMFVNPLAGNYDLMSGSPCIDSGTSDLPAPDIDYYGIDRFNDPNSPNIGGGAIHYYDMGAFEYSDTDDDGLPDWWELKYFGSETAADPTVDEEPDSATNLEEYTHNTDPFKSDPDDDGRDDGEEIVDGTNPWHPDNTEKTYYIDNATGNDMYDGLAASYDGTHGPKLTIQAGIDAAITGWNYIVLVSDGTYTGAGNRDLNFDWRIITLKSENGPDVTIIDCEGSEGDEHCGFYFHSNEGPDSVVEGFTIRNGYAKPSGGIYCHYSSPSIINCTISENSGGNGGGIYCYRNSPIITNCTLSGNSADDGGGIYCNKSSPTITNCTISENSVKWGSGGIYCDGESSPTITNCTISGNSAEYKGGGMECYSNLATLTNCTISGNSAKYGGGLYCGNDGPPIINCIITGNSASDYGGGICCDENISTIINCTISGNSAGNYGGGIYCDDSNPTIINSILWNDSPDEINLDGGGTVTVTYSDIQGGTGETWFGKGCIDADPMFFSPLAGIYDLVSGSPCIDSGTSDPPASDKDFYGIDRFDDPYTPNTGGGPASYYDMGALEYADTDEDGLPDWWELKYFGLITAADPISDNDFDTLTNIQEYQYKTDPLEADLDDDGRDDGEEIADGTNPWHPDNAVKTYYINNAMGNDMYDGLAASYDGIHGPKLTIQAGIDAAVTGWSYTVLVSDGTYTGDGNRDLDFNGKAITVRSENGPNLTIIDCEGSEEDKHRGFDFHGHEGPDSVVDGFTIRNGYAELGGGIYFGRSCIPTINNCVIISNWADEGGGIFFFLYNHLTITNCMIIDNGAAEQGGGINCEHSNPTITNCTIKGNSAGMGGGLYSNDSNSAIVDCIIKGNSAGMGGGIMLRSNNSPAIKNCVITDNWAGENGGGILCSRYDDPNIVNCKITGNLANNSGGGIYCYYYSNLSLTNCKISGNLAENGGGIYFYKCHPKITNCAIIGNSANNGGGIYSYIESKLVITNSIIVGNAANNDGGGIYCDSTTDQVITNCILWSDSPNEIYVSRDSPIVSFSDVQGGTGETWFGEGCIDADPCFVANGYWDGDTWVEGDYHLTAVSPCIDAGTNDASELPLFDLDGNLRIWIGRISYRVDMGAYEYGSKTVGISNIRVLGISYVELTWLCSDMGATEFDVWYSDDEFSATMTWSLLEGDVPSGGVETKCVDTTASSAGMRYYKISY